MTGVQLINVLNKNVGLKKAEKDDGLFFLSLVSEIKKVPEHIRLRTKAQIKQVIIEAQTSVYNYCNSTSDCVRHLITTKGHLKDIKHHHLLEIITHHHCSPFRLQTVDNLQHGIKYQ